MAITAVQEPTVAVVDNATSATKAFASNVTSGNLILIGCSRYAAGGNTAFVAADCTKSAGTATIGTVTLDKQSNVASANPTQAGVWSVPVTGSGSLTIAVAGPAGSYFTMAIGEYSGTDVSGSRIDGTPSSNTATTGTNPVTSGTTTSTGDALFFGVAATDYADNTYTPTPGNSFTNIGVEGDGSAHQTGIIARRIVTGAATTGLSESLAGSGTLNGWAAVVVAYKVAGGGGGVTISFSVQPAPGAIGNLSTHFPRD